jgi:hypothetical protein
LLLGNHLQPEQVPVASSNVCGVLHQVLVFLQGDAQELGLRLLL